MAANPGPAVAAGAKGAKGNILTKKIGPLPGWAWAAIGLGGIYLWKKHQAAAASAASTSTTPDATLPGTDTAAPSGYGYQGPGVSTSPTTSTSSTGGWRRRQPGNGVSSPAVVGGGTTTSTNTAPAAGSPASIAANTLNPNANPAVNAVTAAAESGQSVANETSVYSQTPSELTALGYSPSQQALYYDPNPADLLAYNDNNAAIANAQAAAATPAPVPVPAPAPVVQQQRRATTNLF